MVARTNPDEEGKKEISRTRGKRNWRREREKTEVEEKRKPEKRSLSGTADGGKAQEREESRIRLDRRENERGGKK